MCQLAWMAFNAARTRILREVCGFLNDAEPSDINRIAEKLRDVMPDEAERAHARYVLREVARRL